MRCRPRSEVPAQTPFKEGWSRAYSRHSLATGHRAQRTEARTRLEPSGGKNSVTPLPLTSRPFRCHAGRCRSEPRSGKGSSERIAASTNSMQRSAHPTPRLALHPSPRGSPHLASGDVVPSDNVATLACRDHSQVGRPSNSGVARSSSREVAIGCRRPGTPPRGARLPAREHAAVAAPQARIISSSWPGSDELTGMAAKAASLRSMVAVMSTARLARGEAMSQTSSTT